MEFVIFYLIFVVAVGANANARGRSGIGWALLALVISPLIAVVIVALIPSRHTSAAPVDLETAIRNQQLANDLGRYVRRYKPPFSVNPVYIAEIDGTKKSFANRIDALAYVATQRQGGPADP